MAEVADPKHPPGACRPSPATAWRNGQSRKPIRCRQGSACSPARPPTPRSLMPGRSPPAPSWRKRAEQVEYLDGEGLERRPPMVDGRRRDSAQHSIGDIRGTRNL
jgi:hypothetical protein